MALRARARSVSRRETNVNLKGFLETRNHYLWEFLDQIGISRRVPCCDRERCSKFNLVLVWGKVQGGKKAFICHGRYENRSGNRVVCKRQRDANYIIWGCEQSKWELGEDVFFVFDAFWNYKYNELAKLKLMERAVNERKHFMRNLIMEFE